MEAIQAIAVALFSKDFNFVEFPEPFSKMSNLRLLKIHTFVPFPNEFNCVPNEPRHFPNELRYLSWDYCSLKCLISSFQPQELVEFTMHYSNFENFWEGVKVTIYIYRYICFNCLSIIYSLFSEST